MNISLLIGLERVKLFFVQKPLFAGLETEATIPFFGGGTVNFDAFAAITHTHLYRGA